MELSKEPPNQPVPKRPDFQWLETPPLGPQVEEAGDNPHHFNPSRRDGVTATGVGGCAGSQGAGSLRGLQEGCWHQSQGAINKREEEGSERVAETDGKGKSHTAQSRTEVDASSRGLSSPGGQAITPTWWEKCIGMVDLSAVWEPVGESIWNSRTGMSERYPLRTLTLQRPLRYRRPPRQGVPSRPQ